MVANIGQIIDNSGDEAYVKMLCERFVLYAWSGYRSGDG